MKIEEWDELKQLMMKGIMGSQAQYKLVQTPVNRSADTALDICASYACFLPVKSAFNHVPILYYYLNKATTTKVKNKTKQKKTLLPDKG